MTGAGFGGCAVALVAAAGGATWPRRSPPLPRPTSDRAASDTVLRGHPRAWFAAVTAGPREGPRANGAARMRILVTGGAGYIGSVIAEELLGGGHEVVVLDDLSNGHARRGARRARAFVQRRIADAAAVPIRDARSRRRAALRGAVAGRRVGGDARQLLATTTSRRAGAARGHARGRACAALVFSSTAAIYGEPAERPSTETDPTAPTNPYGETKLAFERALAWYEARARPRRASLRYFNAAGATRRRSASSTTPRPT